jgi:hypothetical protein
MGLSGKAESNVFFDTIIKQQAIVLVTLYAKAKTSDLSKAEENELRVISAEIRRSLGSRKP